MSTNIVPCNIRIQFSSGNVVNSEFGFIYQALYTIKPNLTAIVNFKSTSWNKPAVEDRKVLSLT